MSDPLASTSESESAYADTVTESELRYTSETAPTVLEDWCACGFLICCCKEVN